MRARGRPEEGGFARSPGAEGARALELPLHALLLHVAQELAGLGEAAGKVPGDGGVVGGDEVGRGGRVVLAEPGGEEAGEGVRLGGGECGSTWKYGSVSGLLAEMVGRRDEVTATIPAASVCKYPLSI